MHYIGVDIAKATHTIGILDEKGSAVGTPFKVNNSAQGFEKMLVKFKDSGIHAEDALIGLEATGHYWLVIFEFLVGQGFDVSVINPIQTDAFRDVASIRKTKTDAIDCMLIADLLRFGSFEPSGLADEAMGALKQLARFRTGLVTETSALKNKVTALIDRVFPEWIGGLAILIQT